MGAACACEHILDSTNNPENILILILHSSIRSLLNLRFCQIRPIFRILLFWSKLKNVCKQAGAELCQAQVKLEVIV